MIVTQQPWCSKLKQSSAVEFNTTGNHRAQPLDRPIHLSRAASILKAMKLEAYKKYSYEQLPRDKQIRQWAMLLHFSLLTSLIVPLVGLIAPVTI